LTGGGDSYVTVAAHDFALMWDNDLKDQAAAYAGSMPLDHPLISPVFHDDFSGLPPTMIQVGTREILLSDSIIVNAKMKACGIDVSLEVYEGMPHVWHVAVPIPEAKAAIAALAGYLRKCLGM